MLYSTQPLRAWAPPIDPLKPSLKLCAKTISFSIPVSPGPLQYQHPPAAAIAVTRVPFCCYKRCASVHTVGTEGPYESIGHDKTDTCLCLLFAGGGGLRQALRPVCTAYTPAHLSIVPQRCRLEPEDRSNLKGHPLRKHPPAPPWPPTTSLGLWGCRTERKVSRSAYSRTKHVCSSRAFRSCSYDIRDIVVAVRCVVRAHPLLL